MLGRFILQPTSFLVDCERRYGEYFTLRLSDERTMVITSDPEAVKTVFTGDPAQLLAGEEQRHPPAPARRPLGAAARRAPSTCASAG